MTTTFVQVLDTEDPARLKRRLDEVGATPDNPPYLFLVLQSGGQVRDYAIGIALPN
jgi:hypothetical protein